ncbi:MAG: hypothetical protein KA369_11845 [Spirochaetes bacterium]|nr:hypothetical protein [Spirochaetota bacterium]
MNKFLSLMITLFFLSLINTGCSKSQMESFQTNEQKPPYSLFDLFQNFPSLQSGVDSLDTQRLNDGLGEMILEGFEIPLFLRDTVNLVEAPFLVPMIKDINSMIKIILDTTPHHYADSPTGADCGYYDSTDRSIDRLAQFYAALDGITENTEISGDVLAIAAQAVNYLVNTKLDSHTDRAGLETDICNMMKVRLYDNAMYDESSTVKYIDLPVGSYSSSDLGAHSGAISSVKVPIGLKVTLYDADNQTGNSLAIASDDRCLTDNQVGATTNYWNDRARSTKVEYDISRLTTLLGNLTMACDYPMWVNSGNIPPANRDNANNGAYSTNTDLGNSVKGLVKLLYGLNSIAAKDETVRTAINNMILTDLPALLTRDASAKARIENAVSNISYYFAHDETGNASRYDTSADYHNPTTSNGYVNASFKETLRDMLPTLVKLFIRNDGTGGADYSITDAHRQSLIEGLMVALARLKTAGIDYSDSVNAIEPTLKRTIQYNGRLLDRTSDAAWSQMSYLDHLVYTIGSAYHFGFLTRVGSASGEGDYTNFNYGHGIATKGVMTINDCMFSVSTNDALFALIDSITPGMCTTIKNTLALLGIPLPSTMNSYALALAKRTEQGNHISRSSSSFTTGDADSGYHKFYIGYDSPPLLLLPSNCAGDAGIPNGGDTAVTVNSNETETNAATLAANNYRNDYRTYWPRVADGKGVLNTAQFLMSWIARVAWDGQGPYYSTTHVNDTDHPATASYTLPVSGRKTVNVYYKPNGEVYAYVYKPSTSPASWEYAYPNSTQTGIGDDMADPDDANGQRANRYKDTVVSDHYIIKHGSTPYYNLPPMNDAGLPYVNGAADADKYNLIDISGASTNATTFKFHERIGQNQETSPGSGVSIRECTTQEEAIFRNIHWFLFEKKFSFIIPMFVNLLNIQSAGAFILIEANGAVGLANAKKGSANGRWVKLGTEGIPAAANNPNYANTPDYGDSNVPGDGRIMVFCHRVNLLNLGIVYIDAEFLFEKVLGSGHVLPDAIGRNIEPAARLAFLINNASAILSDDRSSKWDTAWGNRNRLAPALSALAGTLRDWTKYVPSTSGYNYNHTSPSPHKYPLADILEGVLIPLGKPMLRRFNSPNDRWVPRVKDETGDTYIYFRPNVSDKGYTPTINNYIPRDSLRTLLSVLAGNSINGYDGVFPMMTDNSGLATRLLGLLQLLGSEPYTTERENIALGLEQLMTAIKFNRSEAITNGYFATVDFARHAWMFNPRAEDVNLEDYMGYEGAFRTVNNWPTCDNWSNFEESYDLLASFMGGTRDVRQNLVNIINAFLAQQLTEDECQGLLYTTGKLLARHDSSGWHYHGYDYGPGKTNSFDQLVKLLTYIPQIHDVMKTTGGTGEKYERLLRNVQILLNDEDSIVHYIVTNITTPYSMKNVIQDLDGFMSWSIVSDPNSPLWDDLSVMLNAIADMNDPHIDIGVMIRNLGFQNN